MHLNSEHVSELNSRYWSDSNRNQPIANPRIPDILWVSSSNQNFEQNMVVKPMQTIQGGFDGISAVSNNTAHLMSILVHQNHPLESEILEKNPFASIEIIVRPVKLGKYICISVKNSDGMYPIIHITENETVYELMERLSVFRGSSTPRQKLLFNSQTLEEGTVVTLL